MIDADLDVTSTFDRASADIETQVVDEAKDPVHVLEDMCGAMDGCARVYILKEAKGGSELEAEADGLLLHFTFVSQ